MNYVMSKSTVVLTEQEKNNIKNLISKLKEFNDEKKLVKKIIVKKKISDTLKKDMWEQLVIQYLVVGGVRNLEKILSNNEIKKEFFNAIKFEEIIKQPKKQIQQYLINVFTKYKPTRFYQRQATKVAELFNNKKIVYDNKFVMPDNIIISKDHNETRNSIKNLNINFKLKSASNFMISTGLSDNVLAIDTRLANFFNKHLKFDHTLGEISKNEKMYYAIEEAFREICKSEEISLAFFDRLIFTYSDMNVIDCLYN